MIRTLLLVSTIFYLGVQSGFSQSVVSHSEIESAIEKAGNTLLKDKDIRSVSIALYSSGSSFSAHFGSLEQGKENPPNNQSIYEIASVTKTMVGYAMAKAVIAGKIGLEDDIRTYLDGEYSNLEFGGNPIRIKHLLSHTSGLPGFLPEKLNGVFELYNPDVPFEFKALEQSVSKQDFFDALKTVSIAQESGSVYSYSNAGTELIGFILESVYQKPLDAILKEILFSPANMSNSGIAMNPDWQAHLVKGYWMKNQQHSPYFANTLWAAGAGVKTNTEDMLAYMTFLMGADDPLVAESRQQLYHNSKLLRIGYFWRIWKDKYGTSYNHHGGSSGMQNWLFLFPKYDLAIWVATNHSGPKTPGKLSKTVKRILKKVIVD